ncbi:MAG: metallophosphoesterase, partial [Armatimonadota bacterium]
MTRRDLLKLGSLAFVSRFEIPLPLEPKVRKPLKFAVITDLHHGLAPDAMARATAFINAVKARKNLDCVLQLGDFCYSDAGLQELLEKFKEIKLPIIHVLGNHDMDRCTKDKAMATIGMKSRFDKFEFGDYTFVVLDLNNIKKNGEVIPYA